MVNANQLVNEKIQNFARSQSRAYRKKIAVLNEASRMLDSQESKLLIYAISDKFLDLAFEFERVIEAIEKKLI